MSDNNTPSTGGVRNLRAIFENKPSEDLSGSPPSRGRSPAHSEASLHSRPVSKVRASFVAVERPGDLADGQQWGLRKASDVTKMADAKRNFENESTPNGAPGSGEVAAQLNGVHNHTKFQAEQNGVEGAAENDLGSILKGSAFEASPPTTRAKRGTEAREPPASPTSQKKRPTASRVNGRATPGAQSKSIGSRIKDAVDANHNQPPPSVKLNTTKDAKPVKPPPTRQLPPSKSTTKSPTLPKTPKTPVSPTLQKPFTRGSAAKPMAVEESAKNGPSPEQAKKSPTLPREPRRASLNQQSPIAARQSPSSPRMNRLQKDAPPTSPEAKTIRSPASPQRNRGHTDETPTSPVAKPGRGPAPARTNAIQKEVKPSPAEAKPKSNRVPAAATASTAASAAKSGTTTLTRKPTTTKRDRPAVKAAAPAALVTKTPAATAPATKMATNAPPSKSAISTNTTVKRPSRASLPAQSNPKDKPKPQTSIARKAPDEGFLARMMRPTASSAQKAHEKVAPSSPPQSKRAAPAPTVKGKSRSSLLHSDEDKENSHRGQQELGPESPTGEKSRGAMNGDSGTESQPLRDITPPEDPGETPADSSTEPAGVSVI
jgi:hypothetical protein